MLKPFSDEKNSKSEIGPKNGGLGEMVRALITVDPLITIGNAYAATAHAPNHVNHTKTFLYARPRFAYSLCNFGGSTIKVIKVICKNNARPCVKRRMSFCACAKSRDLNVLLQSF